MRVVTMAALAVCALLGSTQTLGAAGPHKGQYFVSALGGYYDDPSDLDLSSDSAGYGGTIGWNPIERLSVEAMFLDFNPDVEVGGVDGDGDMDYWSLNLLGKLGRPERWQPYAVVGGGRARYSYDGLQDDHHDNVYTAGLGFFANLTDHLAFRADVRAAYHNHADDVTAMATAGLTLVFGGAPAARVPGDADGDGVNDDLDACPGTPPATAVDSRGCERDSDGDGVIDADDQCPGTPPGVSVDSRGCAPDTDGDGVPDYRDDCPATAAGAQVDERGCEHKLAQPVSFDLTVQFAFNSAEITGVAFQEMLGLLRFLREHPSTSAVIEGHTDSRGEADYNQQLSERRAQAVVEALSNSGIGRDRLTARGYGESKPVASNETEDGRAQNRRVTVVVSGSE